MKLTPLQVFEKLINEDKILEASGQIIFDFSDVSIIVHQRDVVGNILQEWLEGWLKKRGIDYDVNENTQMPPDFFLDKSNHKKGLLEIKAFNFSAGPAFDIADFRMYEEEIREKPWMLDVDYLIFGYDMSDSGIVTVKNVWLKKVWEICAAAKDWPLKLQVKKNVVHKIRPCTWFAATPKFPVFSCKEHFLAAIEETIYQNPATHSMGGTWRSKFSGNYKGYYGTNISIPHWEDIKNLYQ